MIESIEIIGLMAGFLTAFGTLPQSIEIIKSNNTEGISTLTYAMLTFSYILWLIYGIHLNLISIIVWNVIAILFGSLVLILKIFRKPPEQAQ